MSTDATTQPPPASEQPIVDPKTFAFKRAFKDAEEVVSMFERLIQDSLERIKKAAMILDRYNDAPVFDTVVLGQTGQSWRHSASSGWFSSLVKRVTPNYKRVIDGLPTLTQAMLRTPSDDSDNKSRKFQERFTKTVRRWDGWGAHCNMTVDENVIYGYCPNGYTDELDWRPKFWRIDDVFFPEGTPQQPNKVPHWGAKESFLVHELASKLSDPTAASMAGWHVEELIKSVNEAQPKKAPATAEEARKAQDAVRESTISQSYASGARVIEGLHTFHLEPDGYVSYMLLDWRRKKPLLTRLKLFKSMDECLRLFTIEVGNGKLHGSKGMGRLLYNIALQAEQSRCYLKDNTFLSSLFVLVAKTKAKVVGALTVNYPVAIVNENYEIELRQILADVDGFYKLDAHFNSVAELLVGIFMPGQMLNPISGSAEKPTARQVSYTAQVEMEIKIGIIARFFEQFMALIYAMQQRMFSIHNIEQAIAVMAWEMRNKQQSMDPRVSAFQKRLDSSPLYQALIVDQAPKDATVMASEPGQVAQDAPVELDERPMVNDEEAVQCIIDLIKEDKLTPLEVYELGICPPNADMPGDSEAEALKMSEVIGLFAGDPDVDQHTIKRWYLEYKLGVDKARLALLPGFDATIVAEQTRQQIGELRDMMAGDPIPVSDRDGHLIHLETMHKKLPEFVGTLAAGTADSIALAENIMKHFNDHLMGAKTAKVETGKLAPYQQFYSKAQDLILKAKVALSTAAQVSPPPAGATPVNLVNDPAQPPTGAPVA